MSNEDYDGCKGLSKLMKSVWPIHRSESKKFLLVSLVMFCTLFIYTIAKDVKDSLVIIGSSKDVSAACISMLKFAGVLPAALIAIIIFNKLINKFGEKKTFNLIVTAFIVFYFVFGLFLYKNSKHIHFSELWVTNMQKSSPEFLKNFWPLVGNWSLSLFYIFSELWGALVLNSLFWQLANSVTKKCEARRFYGLFACIGNLALIASGKFINMMKTYEDHFVLCIALAVTSMGVILLFLYNYIVKNFTVTDNSDVLPRKKRKKKQSIKENFLCISKTPQLIFISIIVISYGVTTSINEVLFREQNKFKSGNIKGNFCENMAETSIWAGIATILLCLIGTKILSKCKWKIPALVTPLFVLFSGFVILILTGIEKNFGESRAMVGPFKVLEMTVGLGIFQEVITRSTKYSLFDTTKQMAYKSLDKNLRVKGQASVEVIGGRLGKSLGSVIIIILQGFFGANTALYEHSYIFIGVLLVFSFAWIFSVIRLSKFCEEPGLKIDDGGGNNNKKKALDKKVKAA